MGKSQEARIQGVGLNEGGKPFVYPHASHAFSRAWVYSEERKLACLLRRLGEPKNNQENVMQISDFALLLCSLRL